MVGLTGTVPGHAQRGALPRVVTTAPQPRASKPWQAGPTPRLVIVGGEGEDREPFDDIRGVRRLRSGEIVVANNGAGALQIFGADGKYLRSVGRKGGGPGEFQQLWLFHLGPADSLMAFDLAKGFEIFDPAGKYARRMTYGRAIRSWPYGWFADGSQLISVDERRPVQAAGRIIDSASFYRPDKAGALGKELFRYPMYELAESPRLGALPVVFGAGLTAAVWAERYCVGFGERYEIACGARGAPTLLIRHHAIATPVTDRQIERYKTLGKNLPLEKGITEEKARAQQQALFDGRAFAARQPFYSRFIGALSGELWVQRYQIEEAMPKADYRQDIPPEATTWDVFSPAGEWLAVASLPARFRPFQIGADYILGVRLDPNDVQQVVLLPLVR